MTISFIGSYIGTHASTSAQSIALSNLKNAAGATPTLQQNDIVVATVFQAYTATRTQSQLLPTGYTAAHASVLTSTDTNVSSQQSSYKFMGATPDTTITIPASASTAGGVAYSIHVYRGVDTTTPMDVTATTATGINSAQPNPPAITPTTTGAWIYCVGGGAMASGAAPQSTAPTGLDTTTNAWRSVVLTSTTNDPGLAAGHNSSWTSGSFDCPAFTGYTTTNTGSWCAATLALRPITITLSSLYFNEGSFVNTGLVAYGIVARNAATGNHVGSLAKYKTSGSTITCSDSRFTVDSSGNVSVASGATFTSGEVSTLLSMDFVETLSGASNSPLTSTRQVWVKNIALTSGTISSAWDGNDAVNSGNPATVTSTAVTGEGSANVPQSIRNNIGYLGTSTPKVYWEHTLTTKDSTSSTSAIGMIGVSSSVISQHDYSGGGGAPGLHSTLGFCLMADSSVYVEGSSAGSSGTGYTTGDVAGMAVDFYLKKFWIRKNGTWSTLTGDPTAGGAGISFTTTLPDMFDWCAPAKADVLTSNWDATPPTGFQTWNTGIPSSTPARRHPPRTARWTI